MRNRVMFVVAALVGGVLINCSTSMKMGGDGGVPDAGAQACCTAGATFTKLAEGALTATTRDTGPIAVGAYREVVLYTRRSGVNSTSTSCRIQRPQFRPDADTPFGDTGPDVTLTEGGRIQVNGSDMLLSVDFVAGGTCSNVTIDWVVAGVR